MRTELQIPEWLPAPEAPPSSVDDYRIEAMVNGFIAGKQEALFTAPDAFYRLQAADAVEGRPAIAQRLLDLQTATLGQARDDAERAALARRLDLHLGDAMDGIDRHVAGQRRVHQRQVLSQRQALILRAAELEHDNDNKIAGLAEANASAAIEGARMDGIAPTSSEELSTAQKARSQVLRTAISERIANRKGLQALTLFDLVKGHLSAADLNRLTAPIEATRNEVAADTWLQQEATKPGPPLADRAVADPTLTSHQRAIAIIKVLAQESAQESSRVATLMELDDRLASGRRTLAIAPESYEIGTFAKLAASYADAGEPQKATKTRRLALQEPFLQAFAQVSPDRQQKLIDALPVTERPAAEAIQREQSEAFARNTFNPGNALHVDVHSPVPIDSVDEDIDTARLLDAIYGVDQLTRASELTGTTERQDLLHQVQAVDDNRRQGIAGEDAEVARLKDIDPRAKIVRQVRIYVAGGPDYMVADIIFRGNGTAIINITEVKTGSGILTDKQIKVLAEAARTGGVYITNRDVTELFKVKPNVPFGAQNMIPEVYISGGNTAKIERQMRNQGLDVRPAGVRRLRIGAPPS